MQAEPPAAAQSIFLIRSNQENRVAQSAARSLFSLARAQTEEQESQYFPRRRKRHSRSD